MIGIILQLALSWAIIWWFEKGDLRFLGFHPTKLRLKNFAFFFLISAACCALEFVLRIVVAKESWQFNPALNASLFAKGTWWNLQSVLYEEFIFRGVIFYILLKKLGQWKAVLISSAAFGIYHWFSHEVLGDPKQMITTFLITGAAGIVYALGYARTWSLYVPVAMHLGWNYTKNFVFSDGPIGNGMLVLRMQPEITVSYIVFFCIFFLPLISFLILNLFFILKLKQQPAPVFKNQPPASSPA